MNNKNELNQSNELVSVKEYDYLDNDPEIRGQHYFCMSTVCPENVIVQKDVFVLHKFLENISKDLSILFENTQEKFKDDKETLNMLKNIKERFTYLFDDKELLEEYKFYKSQNNDELDKEFKEKHTFQTNVQGIKIRGVYDTIVEARQRAEKLSKIDKAFNIFIGEVGCWCPFNPNADLVQDQEYTETQLNTLIKKYKESESMRETFYQVRKKEFLDGVNEGESSNNTKSKQINEISK